MKKQAKDLQKGDSITIAGQKATIQDIELSDIGKHGKRKARIQATTENNEKIVIIRPEDYPFESN